MFSPSAAEGGPAMATRSRRRLRPKSSEQLLQQPRTKRPRVPLTEHDSVNPDARPEMSEVKPEKAVPPDPTPDAPLVDRARLTPRKDPSSRVKKPKHGDRAISKADGSLLLTSTEAFTASRLPALPDRIKADWSGNQHAEIFSAWGYALSLTPTHAIVWPYNANIQSPESFTFTLPPASKPSDPLPVGCLVSPPASSSEPGLVVVMAGSGKAVYWESISSAATFAFIKKDRSGVEHIISGMSSGEKVVAITSAESAGFVLTFNTGRLAIMNVRDGHGRPSISVQFLRSGLPSSASGLLGSIRNALSQLSLRGDVVSVRADRSGRVGERNVVALTNRAKLQAWKLHRGGLHEPMGDIDARDHIVAALLEMDPISQDFPPESFQAIDFTFVPKGLDPRYLELSRLSDAMASEDPRVHHLLLLVSLTRRSLSRFSLVEVIMTPTSCRVGLIRPITSYSTPLSQTDAMQGFRPRLYLPRPALVAFVVFDRAAVIASIAIPPESPDSQLQSDSHILPASFEDVVDFRDDKTHEVVGSGLEEPPPVAAGHEESRTLRHKITNPALILVVRGAGVVRIVTTDVDRFASDKPPKVSAKSRLEQAVFFGTRKDNPLAFDNRRHVSFTDDEMTAAALQVSQEIIDSSTPFVSTLPASLEDNLGARSRALERLMLHLQATGVNLDRTTRWTLMHNAEKMHVASLFWKRQEAFTASRPSDDKKSIVGWIVDFIHQDQKHVPVAKIGEVDQVRHWFVYDISHLHLFVSWSYEVIKVLYREKLLDDVKMTGLMREAMQINICAQLGAHEFRRANLSLYGLAEEPLRMGILREGYNGLAEPWTGSSIVGNSARRLTDLAELWLRKNDTLLDEPQKLGVGEPDSETLVGILNDLPTLIDGMLTSVLEYARWSMANGDPDGQSQEYTRTYDTERHNKPVTLARFGKWVEGAQIAEKHGCLSALAVVLLEHMDALEVQLSETDLSSTETKKLKALLQAKRSQVEDCFGKYGELFAFAVYEYLLEKHDVATVLEFKLDTLGYKTKFLRSKPDLARISWINDVQEEKDVDHAADTLVDLALTTENQAWNKKIELSLGKLALMAENEGRTPQLSLAEAGADEARREEKIRRVDNELIVLRIQDQLLDLVLPSTYNAVDSAAAVNLAVELHGKGISGRRKALLPVFTEAMGKLLKHEALEAMSLIDLLTLISLETPPMETKSMEDGPNLFWLALKVADCGCRADEVKRAKKLIWRRLYIRDDWAKINDTQLKGDDEVMTGVSGTELYAMFMDCIRFQDARDPFRYMVPQDVAGVFSDQLDGRFASWDQASQAKLMEAMRWEDEVLSRYLKKNRLAKWIQTAFEAAQGDAAAVGLADEPLFVPDVSMDDVAAVSPRD